MKEKRGFTLIELLLVISIVGVLVLIATSSFVGKADSAKEARIKNDIKVNETILTSLMSEEELTLSLISDSEKEEMKKEGFVYSKKGLLENKESLLNKETIAYFPESKSESKLEGDFLVDKENSEVFYYSKKDFSNPSEPSENETPELPEEPKDPEVVMATDDDFEWNSNQYRGYYNKDGDRGFFYYVGKEKKIEIPAVIQGVEMTSYEGMFAILPNFYEASPVEKVVSKNKNIESVSSMFSSGKIERIDLSEFDTSNVKNFSGFLSGGKKYVDVSNLDTSKAENMSLMFSDIEVEALDLSHFDTSNVTNMFGMFTNAIIKDLDISSFDTSKVTAMASMFSSTKIDNLDVKHFNTSNFTAMDSMFYGVNYDKLDLSNFDTSKVNSFVAMFRTAKINELDISGFNSPSSANFNNMFESLKYSKVLVKNSSEANKYKSALGNGNINFTVK